MNQDKQSIESAGMGKSSLVHKTIAVLRAIAASGDGIGLSDLSRATDIPKATCLRILAVLEGERIVMLEPGNKRYFIGFGAVTIVGDLLGSNSPYLHVQQVLGDLVAATGETAGLDVLVDTDVLVVAQVQGPRVIGYSPRSMPRWLNTWNTSTGKVLLAGLSNDEVRARHAAALSAAKATFGSEQDFLEELDEVRRRSYGVARDEMEHGAAAVAAPVRVGGDVAAATWIGGPTFRITEERVPTLASDVIRAAAAIGDIMTLNGGRIAGLVPTAEVQPASRAVTA